MEIVRIFVGEATSEGLYAVKYDEEDCDEFERLFDLWNDTKYVHTYLIRNEQFWKSGYFSGWSVDEIEDEILREADELEALLEDYASDNNIGNLQMLFKPLSKSSQILPPLLEQSKARVVDKKKFPKHILRIYAIRLGPNTFVVTGGAIKLVQRMEGHPDTAQELKKLDDVKKFLRANGLNCDEDLIFYYE